jgi:hypothetical protein
MWGGGTAYFRFLTAMLVHLGFENVDLLGQGDELVSEDA